jgi:hypothetical protein
VWGDDSGAPDDPLENTHTHGTFLSFRQGPGNSAADAVDSGDGVLGNHTTPTGAAAVLERVGAAAGVDVHLGTRAQRGEASDMRNMTAADVATWILTRTPTAFQRMMEANYSIGIERDEARLVRNNADPTKWTNPLEIQCVSHVHCLNHTHPVVKASACAFHEDVLCVWCVRSFCHRPAFGDVGVGHGKETEVSTHAV